MAYKIVVSPRAQKEILKAIDYYVVRSQDAAKYFIVQLEKNYAVLKTTHSLSFAIKT
ncbi:MAG: hypothetical protein ACOVLC_11290 [Flavobacterium sp.]